MVTAKTRSRRPRWKLWSKDNTTNSCTVKCYRSRVDLEYRQVVRIVLTRKLVAAVLSHGRSLSLVDLFVDSVLLDDLSACHFEDYHTYSAANSTFAICYDQMKILVLTVPLPVRVV